MTMSLCKLVRERSEWVVNQASHVTINTRDMNQITDDLIKQRAKAGVQGWGTLQSFDIDIHYIDKSDPALTAQYLFVIDTLNFCFWPSELDNNIEFEYADLAGGIKKRVELDRNCIRAEKLASIDENGLEVLLGWQHSPVRIPLAEERVRLLKDLGAVLAKNFGGEAENVIKSADGSAVELVSVLVANFTGFQDHAIYKGKQVFFYKRAQILCADLYGAFKGQGLGFFHDIDQLTMFADYRVPVVLRELGVLQYSDELASKVDNGVELAPGSQEEIEIRAATVVAVERIRSELEGRPPAVFVDWMLWEIGERLRKQQRPHHRVTTIYY